MATMVARKDVEIFALTASARTENFEGSSSLAKLNAENAELSEKVKKLEEKFEVLTAKIKDLT